MSVFPVLGILCLVMSLFNPKPDVWIFRMNTITGIVWALCFLMATL